MLIDNALTKLVTEIVLCRKIDLLEKSLKLTGKHSMSHFEIYLADMNKMGLKVSAKNALFINLLCIYSGSIIITYVLLIKLSYTYTLVQNIAIGN